MHFSLFLSLFVSFTITRLNRILFKFGKEEMRTWRSTSHIPLKLFWRIIMFENVIKALMNSRYYTLAYNFLVNSSIALILRATTERYSTYFWERLNRTFFMKNKAILWGGFLRLKLLVTPISISSWANSSEICCFCMNKTLGWENSILSKISTKLWKRLILVCYL